MLRGIGRFEAIAPVWIQVTLTSTDKRKTFSFSRLWKVTRLVLELSAGRFVLNIISFLAADADMPCEDFTIGHPVLNHLGIYSRTLLERNHAVLDRTCSSSVENTSVSKECGSLCRLMTTRLQYVNESDPIENDAMLASSSDLRRTRGNFFANKYYSDHFPDPDMISLE